MTHLALQRISRVVSASLAPPPTLSVSAWSDRHRMLSPETSAEPGRFETSRVPYMRAVMNAVNDPNAHRVVVCKAAQVAYTECLGNIIGYYIDQDPTSILVIQPTLEMAESWSRDRLATMIRDTPCLAAKVSDPSSRDSSNTLRMKTFPGGRLSIVGANSPASLASRPVRIIVADECDRFPVSAGTEGDPLSLSMKRSTTFWNRRLVLGSTPTIRGASIIWREFEGSDMRRYFVPCHACGEMQVLKWAGVRWEKDGDGNHLPATAHYVCEHCGSIWDDNARNDAVQKGEWQVTNPDGAKGVAGFHISALMSPWVTLEGIVSEFLTARHDPALLQIFVNCTLGEPWEEPSERLEGASLARRVENYDRETIPNAVLLVTAGVDVQADRLEMSVFGWAAHEESYLIAHDVLLGDPVQPQVWADLEQLLLGRYRTDAGRELRIRAACVDTGGPNMAPVLAFCRPRRSRSVLPTKGHAGPFPIWPKRSSRTHDNGTVFMVGVDTAKEVIYGRLRIGAPGPGFVHFPVSEVDTEYFAQLSAEKIQTKYKLGNPYRVWIKTRSRNEALDCFVMALAARTSLRIRLDAFRDPPPPPPVDQPELEGGADDGLLQRAADLAAAQPPPGAPPAPSPLSGVKHSFLDRQPGWMDRRRW